MGILTKIPPLLKNEVEIFSKKKSFSQNGLNQKIFFL